MLYPIRSGRSVPNAAVWVCTNANKYASFKYNVTTNIVSFCIIFDHG